MIPKLKKYSFFAACSRVFNITESAFINTVFPIILPPASHYLGAFGTCTRQSAHGAQTKKRRYISTFFLILMNIRNDTTPALDLSSGAKRCQYLKVLKYSKISFYGTHAIITDTKIPVIPIINETEFNIRFLVLS